MVVDTSMYSLHLLFGGVWTGAVVFATLAILPLARDGVANAEPLAQIVGKLRTLSRASALVMLATGGHMAGTGYTVESLTGSTRGHLVLGMVALWLLLIVLVEVGGGKLAAGFDEKKVREPAREARPFFLAGSLVAVLLLLDAGLLASGFS
jgi:uncharacterized membrane protein